MDDVIENIVEQLESKMHFLIKQNEALRVKNIQLTDKLLDLAHDKQALLAKQKLTISQIEALVLRLKSIEHIQ